MEIPPFFAVQCPWWVRQKGMLSIERIVTSIHSHFFKYRTDHSYIILQRLDAATTQDQEETAASLDSPFQNTPFASEIVRGSDGPIAGDISPKPVFSLVVCGSIWVVGEEAPIAIDKMEVCSGDKSDDQRNTGTAPIKVAIARTTVIVHVIFKVVALVR